MRPLKKNTLHQRVPSHSLESHAPARSIATMLRRLPIPSTVSVRIFTRTSTLTSRLHYRLHPYHINRSPIRNYTLI